MGRDEHDRAGCVEGEEHPPRPDEGPSRRSKHVGTAVSGVDALEQRLRRHGDGEDDQEHRELRPGEDREPDRAESNRIPPGRLPLHRNAQRQDRPAEGGIGDDLREQERRQHDPGHRDREACNPQAREPPDVDLPREEIHRNGRRDHHERVQPVRRDQAGRNVAVPVDEAQEDGIELVDVVDRLTAQPREQRARLGDGDPEPLVEELVRHHVPVDDARRCLRQHPPRPDDQRAERRRGPDSAPSGRKPRNGVAHAAHRTRQRLCWCLIRQQTRLGAALRALAKASGPIMPGLGVEPRRPEGHPILSRARMTSFATPAVPIECRRRVVAASPRSPRRGGRYAPGRRELIGNRSGPWNWFAAKNVA